MIVIDVGNKYASISNGRCSHSERTSIKFELGNLVQIGLQTQEPKVMYDLMMLLGTKYQDEQFSDNTKFYIYNFQRAKNAKIELILEFYEGIKHRKLHVQTVIALYIRKLIQKFILKLKADPDLQKQEEMLQNQYKQFIKNHKFYFLLSGGSPHPYRYALKQVCQILRIDAPIFSSTIHSQILSFYACNKEKVHSMRSETYMAISLGDRNTTASVYRVHSDQEKIIETLKTKSLPIGGFHFSKAFAIYILAKVKSQKGIDIQRNSIYMSTLLRECERAKINLSEESNEILQKEAFIRVVDLPDQSTFGKIVNQKLFEQIIEQPLCEIMNMIEQMVCCHKGISKIVLHGKGTKMLQFIQRLYKIQKKYKIESIINQNQTLQGLNGQIMARDMDITLFDIADFDYVITGQEGFKEKFLSANQASPTRNSQNIRFPSGQLEFNLKVFENDVKIAHFLLESRPNQSTFGLNFELDRNKLVDLFVKTSKGKIHLPSKFEGLSQQQIEMQINIINDFK